jgi:NTP pyrophosphatase (non-canonical NTP hydrolase)
MFAIGSRRWPGLSKLSEECGEVVQVIGKLMGTGGEPAHWDGSDLRLRLTEELADVLAACDFVAMTNGYALDEAAIAERRIAKLQQFLEWHREQGGAGG